jgi:type VI secretion system secreted protein Hcp
MPTPAYVAIEGKNQGNITQGAFTAESVGNIYQEGHEDECIVQSFKHNIKLPRDPQSGQPSGQRVHNPAVLTKVFDKASPLLYNALTAGEVLPTVEIKWWRTSEDGKQEHYFTTKLIDALIVDITAHMPNCQDPHMEHFTHLEDVSMSYRAIEWTHEVAGTSGSDDWRKPKA